MSSQWQYFLKNLGEWQGSFTHLSPLGEIVDDIPSILRLEGFNNNTTVRLNLRRFPANKPPSELVLECPPLSRSLLFCETGAFSQGSMQWAPFSQFGTELALINGDRRLRLVQMYNRESRLDQLTLIREKLADTKALEKPHLTVEQLLGEWQGEATTLYPDLRPSETYRTNLKIEKIEENRVKNELTYNNQTLTTQARIDGARLLFEQGELTIQILLLDDGASCNCPLEIKPRQSFILELGWLINPNQRQRLIRSYNAKGEWGSLTLVKEEKV